MKLERLLTFNIHLLVKLFLPEETLSAQIEERQKAIFGNDVGEVRIMHEFDILNMPQVLNVPIVLTGILLDNGGR